jgi:hypothetical protein
MFRVLSFPPGSASRLLGLGFDSEGGGDMFLRNVELSPNCMALQPARLYSECCIFLALHLEEY